LATHGYFAAAELSAERKRITEFAKSWKQGSGKHALVADQSVRPPLVSVDVVLAGANQPTESDPGVATGEFIVGLPLEQLRLCVLSACETGLGEVTGHEGVQGLQRAFHLAGCPNVVASLWKVNDAATAALMTKFYYEMWVNKKPPIEALREAQLTIYRRPDLISALALERGLKLQGALEDKSEAKPETTKTTTPTKRWAAFVLSGVGNYP
jgi:CHAT domain-containing protein